MVRGMVLHGVYVSVYAVVGSTCVRTYLRETRCSADIHRMNPLRSEEEHTQSQVRTRKEKKRNEKRIGEQHKRSSTLFVACTKYHLSIVCFSIGNCFVVVVVAVYIASNSHLQ